MPAMLPSCLNGQRQGRSEARGGRYGLEHGACLPRFGKFDRRESSGVDILRFERVPECSLTKLLAVSSEDSSNRSRSSRLVGDGKSVGLGQSVSVRVDFGWL